MKLYYYDHCPYCVRAEMAAYYKEVKLDKVILHYDDADTCIRLVKAKQVPILEFDDGSAMPESLDIAYKLDEIGQKNKRITPLTDNKKNIVDHIETSSHAYYELYFPRIINIGLTEFSTKSALKYFKDKKEKQIGKTFEQAMLETPEHKKTVEHMLETMPSLPVAPDGQISWDDIFIFPILRNITIVKDLKIPNHIVDYITRISSLTNVSLYFDRAL